MHIRYGDICQQGDSFQTLNHFPQYKDVVALSNSNVMTNKKLRIRDGGRQTDILKIDSITVLGDTNLVSKI